MNASLVTPGNRLADVGTDHGYIPITLVQEGRIPCALAMDVNRGPLLRAEEHIRETGLAPSIKTRLSDGVSMLRPGEADSVLVAGMGGPLMIRILREGEKVLESVKELILQPQSEIAQVRRFLETAGYRITDEDMVYEDGKYYAAMRAVHGDMAWEQEIFYRYGKLLLEGRHPVLKQFLMERGRICRQILDSLREKGRDTERTESRIQEMEEELALTGAGLKYYEMQ